jgi:hypothetical protein
MTAVVIIIVLESCPPKAGVKLLGVYVGSVSLP